MTEFERLLQQARRDCYECDVIMETTIFEVAIKQATEANERKANEPVIVVKV